MLKLLIKGLAPALIAAAALPAAALDAPGDYAGAWTLSGLSEGADTCVVTLTGEAAIGGWGLQLAADCKTKFDLSEDIAAWTVYPDGDIGFIDPLRHVLLRFEPTEIGGYVAQPAMGEPIALDRANAHPEMTEQARMSGTWTLTELGGAPTCALTVTSASNGMSGTLRKMETCRAPWTRTDLSRWRRKDDHISLLDRRGRLVAELRGDSFEGFSGQNRGVFVGFVRQWDDH